MQAWKDRHKLLLYGYSGGDTHDVSNNQYSWGLGKVDGLGEVDDLPTKDDLETVYDVETVLGLTSVDI